MEWFMRILDDRAERLRQESARLAADERRDEGDLAKIRANVYGICKSIYQVLDGETARARLEGLRGSWETSQAAARSHGDLKQAAIETIKLETLSEVVALLENGEV